MTNQRTYPLRACFLTGILALFVAGCGSQQEAPQGSTSSAVADATSASTQITLGPKSVHWYMPAPTSEDGITIAAQSAFDESNGVVQDLRNGSSLPWTMPDPGPTSSTASDGDDFLVSGETVSPQEGLQGGESSRSLRRIEGLTGEVLWEVADAGVLLASREGVVGTADQGEALLGLDPADGSVRWKQDVPEGFYALTWRSDYCQSPVAFLAPTVPGAVGSSREPINAANGEVGPKLAKAAPYRVAEGVCATKTGFVSPLEGARYGVYGTAGDLKWSFKDARELVAVMSIRLSERRLLLGLSAIGY